MRILKFGGTSVGSADRLRTVADVVAQAVARDSVVVVVSAFAGVTSELAAAADAAAAGAPLDERWLAALNARHLEALRELAGETVDAAAAIGARVDELARLLTGVRLLGHCSPAARDRILASGERLAAPVVATVLQHRGVPAAAVDGARLVATDSTFGEAEVDLDATRQRCSATFGALAHGAVPVVTGFIGADAGGRITTLGRGGSDYSAAVLAAALDAERVEIWTDVDGVLSADPQVVPAARHLPHLSYRAAGALASAGARVLHPKTLWPLVEPGIPVEVRAIIQPDAPPTRITATGGSEAVRAVAGRTLTDGLAAVTAIADHAPFDARLATRVLAALDRAGIPVETFRHDQDTITATIPAGHLTQAVRLLHRTVVPARPRLALAIAGSTGRVGQALLRQLETQAVRIHEQTGNEIVLVGAINRRRMIWNGDDGIDWTGASGALAEGEAAHWTDFIDKLKSHDGRLIFVDCTADNVIGRNYADLLRAGVAVVTPNKQAGTLPWDAHQALVATSHRTPYRYATAVGAGLPILHALGRIRRGGDRLLGISAVLSGTIGYVFDRLNAGEPFSASVAAAHAAGYTEPHPRDDLDGADVTRKLLIMLREAGLAFELDDIETQSLVPPTLRREDDPAAFLARLKAHDTIWERRVRAAQVGGCRLAYVARFDGSHASVAIRPVPADHPLGRLRGTENLALLTTHHYNDIPLTIAGPGAGVEVTVAGLLADIRDAARALDVAPLESALARPDADTTPLRALAS